MRIEPDEFAKTLKELRIKTDYSIRKAAKVLVGTENPRAWAAYEDTGDAGRQPTLVQASRLLKALGYEMTITITKK